MNLRRLYLFRVFGIPIRLHYTWFFIFVLFAWLLASAYYPPRFPEWSPIVFWVAGILSAFLLFASVLLHELAHSWVALRSGIGIRSITLFLFGGLAQMSRPPPDPKAEFRIAIAGPCASLVLAAFFLILSVLLPSVPGPVFAYLGVANLVLGLFNLVPGLPLDGGRVLRALLWRWKGDLKWATKIPSRAGKVMGLAIIGLGFFSIFAGVGEGAKMDVLPGGIWLIFIGFFLLQAAEATYRQVLLQTALSGTKVRQIMRLDVPAVPPHLTIADLVSDYFLKHGHTGFPVGSETELLGMITLADVKKAPRDEWATVLVKDVMTPLDRVTVLEADEDAVHALQQMVKGGNTSFPVVDAGRPVGMMTREDILQLLKIKTHLAR